MKYGQANMGQFEAVINKLGGMEGLNRYLADKSVVTCPFPIWKTIKLGGYKTPRGLVQALRKAGCFVHESIEHMVENMHRISLIREVDLVRVNWRDMGVKLTAHHNSKPDDLGIFNHELCARALELGMQLCPQEVGPQLRLQYLNQPMQDCVEVMSEPIHGQVFWVSNFPNTTDHPNQTLNLSSHSGDARCYYRHMTYPYRVFVRAH